MARAVSSCILHMWQMDLVPETTNQIQHMENMNRTKTNKQHVFHELHNTHRFDRSSGELLRSHETNGRWLGDEPATSAPKQPRKTSRETQNESETPQIGLSWLRSLIFISRPLCVARTMLRSSFEAHLWMGFFRRHIRLFFRVSGQPFVGGGVAFCAPGFG